MADVKWIKITTDIFDDEKILLIESLPDAYAIITVWFKLLCLAGKQNNSGVFMMGQIAYTDKMLATIFRMKEATVTMALQTFEQFGMIAIIDGVITIPNWGKHQNLDQLETKKQYMRNYMQEYRSKQKALTAGNPNSKANCKTNSKTNVSQAEGDIERDLKKELDNKNNISKKTQKHKHGEYNNVLLTDDELQKLKSEFSDWSERIERLSSYMASTGKSYKSHLATIRNWAKRDKDKGPAPAPQKSASYSGNSNRPSLANIEAMKRMQEKMRQMEDGELKTAGNDENVRKRAEELKRMFG